MEMRLSAHFVEDTSTLYSDKKLFSCVIYTRLKIPLVNKRCPLGSAQQQSYVDEKEK